MRRYDVYVDREYYAVRHQATVMDATPLYKYEVRGKDAAALLARTMVRGFAKFAVGRVAYVCWCDEHGKVLDDGTVTRFADDHFRVTAADPAYAWLRARRAGWTSRSPTSHARSPPSRCRGRAPATCCAGCSAPPSTASSSSAR